jgi:hypothetical protein
MRCPNGLLGLITVSCYDTEFSVIDGVCGDMNCPESTVSSNGAVLGHFAINNGWRAGPTTCPNPFEGIATFQCRNGTTTVDEVTMQLAISPEDVEAVAIGNESSADSRFILCGCCHPLGAPPGAEPVKGRDTGVYIWILSLGGGIAIVLSAISGWYFLPRKKSSRVWPEKIKPPDPRPVRELQFEKILDRFTQELVANPKMVQSALEKNHHLKMLPVAEQKLAIESIKQDPNAAKKFFTRRSVQYLLACEDSVSLTALEDVPSPTLSNKSKSGRIGQQPPQLALGNNDALQVEDQPGNPALAFAITDGQGTLPLADTDDLRNLGNPAASGDLPEASPKTSPKTSPKAAPG